MTNLRFEISEKNGPEHQPGGAAAGIPERLLERIYAYCQEAMVRLSTHKYAYARLRIRIFLREHGKWSTTRRRGNTALPAATLMGAIRVDSLNAALVLAVFLDEPARVGL